MMKSPIHVAVTGAAGAIGYAILFRLASGEVFGHDQPLVLRLVDIDAAMGVMGGVILELEDCAFPVLQKVIATADPAEGFRGVHWALLIGSVPRKPGMERRDLLAINGKIFTGQGQALQKNAARDVRILVVGNPCNTNCLVGMNSAPEIPRDRWFAMTRLDENRAKAQLAAQGREPASARFPTWASGATTAPPCSPISITPKSAAGPRPKSSRMKIG